MIPRRFHDRYTETKVSFCLENFAPSGISRRSEPFDSDDFIFELKIDGFRALATGPQPRTQAQRAVTHDLQ